MHWIKIDHVLLYMITIESCGIVHAIMRLYIITYRSRIVFDVYGGGAGRLLVIKVKLLGGLFLDLFSLHELLAQTSARQRLLTETCLASFVQFCYVGIKTEQA